MNWKNEPARLCLLAAGRANQLYHEALAGGNQWAIDRAKFHRDYMISSLWRHRRDMNALHAEFARQNAKRTALQELQESYTQRNAHLGKARRLLSGRGSHAS